MIPLLPRSGGKSHDLGMKSLIPPARIVFLSRRQSTSNGIAIGSTTFSLGQLLGIAIGGALVLFGILASIAIYRVRRKHPRQRNRNPGVRNSRPVDKELALDMQSANPGQMYSSRRLSFNPFSPPPDITEANEWTDEDVIYGPVMANTKKRRSSLQRRLFRMSGVRDSWPLGASIQLPQIPFPLQMHQAPPTLSPVAPPGYVLPEPKWPKRTYSRAYSRSSRSMNLSIDGSQWPPFSTDPYEEDLASQAEMQKRRSTSENQLSSILRSTSQRLKAPQGLPLARTTSTLSHNPGLPPMDRLPSPPLDRPTESRQEHMELEYPESVGSSAYESYLVRTPSPDKKIPRSAGQVFPKSGRSPTPSGGSDDSLCGRDTPDLVIPAPLTSPSKNSLRGEQRPRVRVSLGGAKDISALIHQDSRASVLALGNRGSIADRSSFLVPHRISLASDPFYSSVRSSKPVIPTTQILGPRPLYIRKSSFGQEATSERPLSFVSPLRDVSGNKQSPLESAQPPGLTLEEAEPNPFLWSPQEAMRTRAGQTSPKRAGPRRHKRSHGIRTSGIPRPPSVCVVPEELEEDSPPTSLLPNSTSSRFVSRFKSESPSPSLVSSRPTSVRPPSTLTFNPRLTVSDLDSRAGFKSPPPKEENCHNAYSPTLSVYNYYSENNNSEDEFFNHKRSTSKHKAIHKNRAVTEKANRGSATLTLFPPLSASNVSILNPSSLSPAVNSLSPALASSPSSMPNIRASVHLTGPRTEPHKRFSSSFRAPRDSLQTSICMLRRMNSEVSTYSNVSSAFSDGGGSPSVPDLRGGGISPTRASHSKNRASKHYLTMGAINNSRWSRRRSTKVLEEIRDREQRKWEWDEEDEGDQEIAELQLTPVKEDSSPAKGVNALGIQNLKVQSSNEAGTIGSIISTQMTGALVGKLAPYGKENTQIIPTKESSRWSDAMMKPVKNGVRRESKMEHPSPKTQHKWKWGKGALGSGTAGKKDSRVETVRAQENGTGGRPDSLGYYDDGGFLKSTPDRELARLRLKAGMRI